LADYVRSRELSIGLDGDLIALPRRNRLARVLAAITGNIEEGRPRTESFDKGQIDQVIQDAVALAAKDILWRKTAAKSLRDDVSRRVIFRGQRRTASTAMFRHEVGP
jgi:hypothetical protein